MDETTAIRRSHFVLVLSASFSWAQKSVRISIVTGGTGGVYYPLGGGMANIISKYIPYVEATAEVTTASVDNCLLVGRGSADVAFTMADTAWDAYMGVGKAFQERCPKGNGGFTQTTCTL